MTFLSPVLHQNQHLAGLLANISFKVYYIKIEDILNSFTTVTAMVNQKAFSLHGTISHCQRHFQTYS